MLFVLVSTLPKQYMSDALRWTVGAMALPFKSGLSSTKQRGLLATPFVEKTVYQTSILECFKVWISPGTTKKSP